MTQSRRTRVRRLFIDLSPLRDLPTYRLLWTGQSINVIGNQITRVALPYQVYVLTHSTLAIAGLTFVQLVPILTLALFGGSLADASDRRRLLLVLQLGMAGTSLALALVSILGTPSVLLLYALAMVSASFGSMEGPTRSSTIPRLVPAHRLPAAIALNELAFTFGSVAGPALAGLVLATVGVGGAYALDVATFGLSLLAVVSLPSLPPLGSVRPGLAAIREGLGFVRSRRVILSTFAIDLDAMVFGMPSALFPALALDVFHVGPVGVGLLNAAPAAGAFVGALLSGIATRIRRMGIGIIAAVAVWGGAIALFGLVTWSFPLALALLALAGAADVVSAVLRSSVLQLATPDELRGRVSAIHSLVVTSGPRVGDMEAAGLAAVVGTQVSVVSGGLLCLAGIVVVARAFPELARHTLEPPSVGSSSQAFDAP